MAASARRVPVLHWAARERPAPGRPAVRGKAGPPATAEPCAEPPGRAPNGARPGRPARQQAVGLGPSAPVRCGAGHLRSDWAGPPAASGARAEPAARSGREPAAGRPAQSWARAEPPERPAARSGRARRRRAAAAAAAARYRPAARPCRRAAPMALAQTEHGVLWVERRRGVPERLSGAPARRERQAAQPAAGQEPAVGRDAPDRPGPDVPDRRERGAPARPARAGDADPAGRRRRAGPGRAGRRARRNCPATRRWRE